MYKIDNPADKYYLLYQGKYFYIGDYNKLISVVCSSYRYGLLGENPFFTYPDVYTIVNGYGGKVSLTKLYEEVVKKRQKDYPKKHIKYNVVRNNPVPHLHKYYKGRGRLRKTSIFQTYKNYHRPKKNKVLYEKLWDNYKNKTIKSWKNQSKKKHQWEK